MTGLRVGVFGARGRMGAQTCRALGSAPDLELVAALGSGDDRDDARDAQVMVDFTRPEAVGANLDWCLEHGVHAVVGTTGLTPDRLDALADRLAGTGLGVVVAANFSVGAVLMMRFAEQAAAFYDSVEIVELHHPRKADAPSGTATTTAHRIAAARSAAGLGAPPDATTHQVPGARGAEVAGVAVHSVRLAGLVAHQEVLLGAEGETLSIRHDSLDRVSFMPGVLAAVRAVGARPGLTVGIEDILGVR